MFMVRTPVMVNGCSGSMGGVDGARGVLSRVRVSRGPACVRVHVHARSRAPTPLPPGSGPLFLKVPPVH